MYVHKEVGEEFICSLEQKGLILDKQLLTGIKKRVKRESPQSWAEWVIAEINFTRTYPWFSSLIAAKELALKVTEKPFYKDSAWTCTDVT